MSGEISFTVSEFNEVYKSSNFNPIVDYDNTIAKEKAVILEELRERKKQQTRFIEHQESLRKLGFELPMPSHSKIMTSNIDYQFLARVMLDSKFGGLYSNMYSINERFIYKNELYKITDDSDIPDIAKELNISLATFKRRVRALLNTNLGVVEVGKNDKGNIFYKIKYSVDDKYYVTINNDMLKRLVTSTNSNMIKIYIVMKYLLTTPIYNDIGQLVDYNYLKKQITYDFLLEKIGLAKNYKRDLLKGMLEDLALLGYIRISEIEIPRLEVDKKTNKTTVAALGYEYEIVSFEDWQMYIDKAIIRK